MDGAPQAHTFHAAGDVDIVKFDAVAGRSYVIRTLDLAPRVDTAIGLYSSDWIRIASNDDDPGGGPASRIDFAATVSGTFYIRIANYDPGYGACEATYAVSAQESP